jgi:hypothetical protein
MEANGGGGWLEPGGRWGPSAGERKKAASRPCPLLGLPLLAVPGDHPLPHGCRLWRDITGTEAFRRDHRCHHCGRPMPLLVYRAPGLARCSIHATDTRNRMTGPLIARFFSSPVPPSNPLRLADAGLDPSKSTREVGGSVGGDLNWRESSPVPPSIPCILPAGRPRLEGMRTSSRGWKGVG